MAVLITVPLRRQIGINKLRAYPEIHAGTAMWWEPCLRMCEALFPPF